MNDLAKVDILRTNGTREVHEVGKRFLLMWIQSMIGAQLIDTVDLREGVVMLVDDTGLVDGKPINQVATAVYRSVCRPGADVVIAGDVAICLDKDFS